MEKDCIFCKIVAGEISCSKIYEDSDYLAFLDMRPTEDAHTLVIPKKHFKFVWDVEPIGKYFEICQKIAKHFQIVSGNEFVYAVVHGVGVAHAHVHIVPTEEGRFGKALTDIGHIINHPPLTPEKAQEMLKKYKF
ncbi:MAG: HIT domain-containing protein [Candidatus Dojkabacteria bacterium]